MKKFISLFLVFSILALSGNLFAKERKGADLIIQRTDGTQVRGELIAVKENSLLLMGRDSGADVTVDIEDIRVIKIVKMSKALLGAVKGFSVGVSVGAIGGLIGWEIWNWAPQDTKTKYRIVAYAGAICGLVGALLWAEFESGFKTIQLEGKSDSEIKLILEYLRKKARIRNSQ